MHRATCACVLIFGTLVGCAGSFDPRPIDEIGFLERSQTQEREGVRVTVAVPSRKETRALFADDLYRRGVQPIWIEIENLRDEEVTYLPVGTDPHYYSALEAANLDAEDVEDAKDERRNRYFFDASFDLWLDPGEGRAGFVFTNLDEGSKAFNVDVTGRNDPVSFTFFVPVPGLKIDHYEVDWDGLYPPERIRELDQQTLIDAIAEFTCCATDKKGEGTADPLNIVIIGSPRDIYYSFLRAGWDETETISRASTMKTVRSFLTGGEYRYSPVSSLYAFGRKQDIAFQKARENINERNHLRLWISPARFEGKPVWIGQISRDIGVHFTRKTITTHKIDPNVDETREYLLEDLAYAQTVEKFGYALGVGAAPVDAPRGNLTGDPYFTDGYRLVLWLSSTPADIADIEFVPWALPPYRRDPEDVQP